MTSPQDLGLCQQADAIRRGVLDPVELLDATLTRIAERDEALNSTPVVMADQARKMLAEAPDGPLHGVPLTIKDMYALPWRGARNGTALELFPASASGMYRLLRDAGAVLVGVANQHESGMGTTGNASAYGRHGNPWDPTRSPGGSSGGSAAAVAARLVAGSVGSDSGGSTRLPAAYCGVVGLKITYGSVPYDGYFGLGTTFSAPGALCRDAADTRLLTEAMLDRDLGADGTTRLRVGVVDDPFWSDADPAVAVACREAIDAAGWHVVPVGIEHLQLAGAASLRLIAEVGLPPAAVLRVLSAPTRALLLSSALLPARLVPAADRVRAALRRALAVAFTAVDVVAWPTSPAPAPPLDDPTVHLPSGPAPADLVNVRSASLANLCGVPGISLPVGLHPSGLPVGLQLLGPWGEEGRLLHAADQLERATGRAHVDLVPAMAGTA